MTFTFHTFAHIVLYTTPRLHFRCRCTTSETFYSVKISFARATQLRRVIVGIAVHAPFVLLLRQTLFELEESLSLFPVVQLKAEQKFIIEEIVGRRDV